MLFQAVHYAATRCLSILFEWLQNLQTMRRAQFWRHGEKSLQQAVLRTAQCSSLMKSKTEVTRTASTAHMAVMQSAAAALTKQ